MARKKIVFVIVEGPSDAEALEILLNRIYDKNSVYLKIMYGDVTTENGSSYSTILSKLGGILQAYMKNNHLAESHFQEIIHIVDMDGAYVPDSIIVKDETAHRTRYPQHQRFIIFRIRHISCPVTLIMYCTTSLIPLMRRKREMHSVLQRDIVGTFKNL